MELISLGDRGQDMVRARTYGRQSHKSESDSQASPKMQKDTGIAFINSQAGWEHTGHYEDVGLSGYDPNVYRPDFERMLEDARKGEFDVLVIYMLSRLTRQGAAEALKIQQELAKYGVALVSTQEPFINTSDDNPFGVAFFALIAGLAHQESKNKSKFIKDAFAVLKAKGSHSSGPVPHGFVAEEINVDGITIRQLSPGPRARETDALNPAPMPADSIDFIIDGAEDGKTANAIATELTEKGYPTPLDSLDEEAAKARKTAAQKRRKGGESDAAQSEWSSTVVLRILRDPRLAGYAIGPVDPKTKMRTILRDEEGQPVQAHEGFVSPKRWYDIQQTLNGRKRERRRDRTGELTLLGSWGFLRCGRCDAGMTVARSSASYACNLRRTVGEVPKHVMRIGMESAEQVVVQRVWARLGALDPSDSDDVEWLAVAAERFAVQGVNPEAAAELAEQEAQLEHVQESIRELTEDRDAYVGPTARKAFRETMAKYAAHEERCAARIDELRASATTSARLPVDEWMEAGDGDPFAPGGVWSRWDVVERRAFLSLFVDRAVVLPEPTKRGPAAGRAEQRIEITWASRPEPEGDEEAD
ncbi:recombinase family protein [Streptomyces sp. NPDC006326]|uniref:recombinase family protein n=1 Tax=Streptomyces sp. NPDC006326 TaxID=3156752 RepID=UPI0033B4965B